MTMRPATHTKARWRMLAAGAACMMAATMLQAQDGGGDNGPAQAVTIPAVPGQAVNHQGFAVSPTPQKMTLDKAGRLDISAGVKVRDKKKKFANDIAFLKQNPDGPRLDINFNPKTAVRKGVEPRSGAYRLTIDKDGIDILGYDERGAYYALQTLRQLAQSPAGAGCVLPYAQIDDYPDLPSRGVVEGFYGTPWSHEVRLSLIRFYGENKMNTYVYGPKDAPYHRNPDWRKPYPEEEAARIRQLVEACRASRTDFVWAVHPGQDIRWDEEDYHNLTAKFEHMYGLGVRAFAIFFDDISGQGTDPARQTALLNRLQKEFVKRKGDVAPLIICPTDYSKLWANGGPDGALSIYGNKLDPEVRVFWTGDYVCSDLTKETLQWVDSRIKRPAYYWWNFPVTDYARNIVMQGPAYGLDNTLTDKDLYGILSNPMEYGEASKIALYGVADYGWNIKAYNPMDNWERALTLLMPQAREAYKTFAIHSCDTGKGYRRDESWNIKTFTLADWNDAKASALDEELKRMRHAPEEIRTKCRNGELLREIAPWLTQLEALAQRCAKAIDLGRNYRTGQDDAKFWEAYRENLMTHADSTAYAAHTIGSLKLQPFYARLMEDMGKGYLDRLADDLGLSRQTAAATDTLRTDDLGISLHTDHKEQALKAFDRSLSTLCHLKGKLSIGLSQKKRACIVLAGRTGHGAARLSVCLMRADGSVIAQQNISRPYTYIALDSETSVIEIEGDGEIYEIVTG